MTSYNKPHIQLCCSTPKPNKCLHHHRRHRLLTFFKYYYSYNFHGHFNMLEVMALPVWLYATATVGLPTRVRTILALGNWVLGNICSYWAVLLLGDIFSLWHPIRYWAVSTFHMITI